MTYYWGDVYSRHLLEGSILEGKIGTAPTPGVTKVLDPNGSGKLVDCTEEICPYGKTYPDIGRVTWLHLPPQEVGQQESLVAFPKKERMPWLASLPLSVVVKNP